MLISLASFVLASFVGTKAFEWKSPATEGDIHVYTCNGNVVTFPWDFNMDNDTESLINIKWFEQGNVVAIFAAGHFLSDNSNVEHVPLAGLRVNGVKVGDTYTVTLDVENSSGLASYTHTGHVDSVEPPELVNGHLELELEPSVTMDEATGQWFVELRCGHFVSLGHPPVTVRWMTPSGQEMNSSGYHHGSFVLNLPPDHVDTGDYTCSLDNTGTDQALDCLPPLHAQRSLYVDGKEVLVKVLEEEKGVLQDWVNRMADLLQQSQAEITDLRRNGSDLEAQLKTCLMLNTTSCPATTTKPSTGTQEMGTCEDAADNCSWFNIWKCTDPTEGPHYRTVCRKTCGLCHDVSMASTTSLPTATTTTATTTTPISTKTTQEPMTTTTSSPPTTTMTTTQVSMASTTSLPTATTTTATTTTPISTKTTTQERDPRPPCEDDMEFCFMFIDVFHCDSPQYRPYYRQHCRKSCGFCHEPMTTTTSSPPTTTMTTTRVSMASTTSLPTATTTTATTTTPISAKTTTQERDPRPPCEDDMQFCFIYIDVFHCDSPQNRPYYRQHCRKSCGFCHEPMTTTTSSPPTTTMTRTRDPMTTTTSSPPSTSTMTTTQAVSTRSPCVDSLEECREAIDQGFWSCWDPMDGEYFRSICRKSCNACDEHLVAMIG